MKVAAGLLAAVLAATPADDRAAERSVELDVTAFSSSDEVATTGPLASLQIEAAWLAFQDLGFRDKAACDEAGAPRVKGPVTVELVTGKAHGMPATIGKLVGPFCGAELVLRRSRTKVEGVPAGLRGFSILVRARMSDGTAVIVRSKTVPRVWIPARRDEGFTVTRDGMRWFLAVDVARWFGGIDLAIADVSQEGDGPVIRIDERNNEALLAAFEGAIAAGFGLYEDADGDGALQASERSGQGWLAGSP